METLPTKVALHVLSNLDEKTDLKALRMVSRKWCDRCTPLLFRRVYASLHRKDIEVLNHISSHPVLRLFVAELVYNGVRFSRNVLYDLKDISHPNVAYYEKRCGEQRLALKDNSNYIEITGALNRMPNLQRVILANHWRPTRDLLGNYGQADGQWGVSAPEGARLAVPLCREYPADLERPIGRLLKKKYACGSNGPKADFAFEIMSQAVSLAKTQLQDLVIDYSCDVRRLTSGISPSTLNIANENFQYSYELFRHLRRISFTLEKPKTYEDYDASRQSSLSKLLSSADCLEELSLDFRDGSFDPESGDQMMPLATHLGTRCWPRLRLLRLYSKACTLTELSEAIQRHCKSLRVLHLHSFRLAEGTWQEAAERWHQCLRLEEIECQYLYERPDNMTVGVVLCDEFEKYIMKGECTLICTYVRLKGH